MKTIFKNTFYLKIIIVLSLLLSCSKEDDLSSDTISSPSVSFVSTNYETIFFESGSTSAPTVNWNGEQGTLNLGSNINGVTLNSTTGVISWSKGLPIGINTIELVASNSAGQTVIEITIENIFQGTFTGGLNYLPNNTTSFSNSVIYSFNTSGEVQRTQGSYQDFGSWTRDGNSINTTFDSINYPFRDILTLSYDENEGILEGFWFYSENTIEEPNGYLRLVYSSQ